MHLLAAKTAGSESKGGDLHNKTANIYGMMEKFYSEEDGFSGGMNLADEMMKAFGHNMQASDEDDEADKDGGGGHAAAVSATTNAPAPAQKPDGADQPDRAKQQPAAKSTADAVEDPENVAEIAKLSFSAAVEVRASLMYCLKPNASPLFSTFKQNPRMRTLTYQAFVDIVYKKSPSPRRSKRHKHKSKSKSKHKRKHKHKQKPAASAEKPPSPSAALAAQVLELTKRCEKDIRNIRTQFNIALDEGFTAVIERLRLPPGPFKASIDLFLAIPLCQVACMRWLHMHMPTTRRRSRGLRNTLRECSKSQCPKHSHNSSCWFEHAHMSRQTLYCTRKLSHTSARFAHRLPLHTGYAQAKSASKAQDQATLERVHDTSNTNSHSNLR